MVGAKRIFKQLHTTGMGNGQVAIFPLNYSKNSFKAHVYKCRIILPISLKTQ